MLGRSYHNENLKKSKPESKKFVLLVFTLKTINLKTRGPNYLPAIFGMKIYLFPGMSSDRIKKEDYG